MKANLIFAVFCIALFSTILAEEEVKNEEAKKEATPQIVYIHYSTPEEAELAQKQILAQYEALGGSATIVTGEEAAKALAKEEARQASSTPASTTTNEENVSESS